MSNSLMSLSLVTTMKPIDGDQVRKVPLLLKLFASLQRKGIRLAIRIDDTLHGKVYVGRKGDLFVGAIVTSANFTGNGLKRNHEWGVFINDSLEIQQIYDQIIRDTERLIVEEDLEKMNRWMELHKFEYVMHPKNNLDLLDLIAPPKVNNRSITYWLKPYGTVKNQIESTTLFDSDPFRMTFAKGVSKVKEGDVFVAYSVGSRKLLSVFVATSIKGKLSIFPAPEEARWPFYVVCNNVTPKFGASWAALNLTLDYLKDTYLQKYPDKELRPGSQSFGALQWGLDRLKIDREFAEFVIDKMLRTE